MTGDKKLSQGSDFPNLTEFLPFNRKKRTLMRLSAS